MLISSSISNITNSDSRMLKNIHERIIKNFMDTIVMSEIRAAPLSGYDAITFIRGKYGFLLSSGTVYSMLYSLERKGLIKGITESKKTVYHLTEKGEKNP
jgi:DNA-binding PadR family transcriptional regulator